MPYVDHCYVGGNRLLMQINAYLDFNPFSLGSVSYTHLTLPTTPYV